MASPGPTLEPGRVGWGGGPGWNPALKLVISTDGGAGRPRGPKRVLLAQLGSSFCARSPGGQRGRWAPSNGTQWDTPSCFLEGSSSPGEPWRLGFRVAIDHRTFLTPVPGQPPHRPCRELAPRPAMWVTEMSSFVAKCKPPTTHRMLGLHRELHEASPH